LAILIWSLSWWLSFGLIFRDMTTSVWCAFVPMGMISVFSMLNFAPDTVIPRTTYSGFIRLG
jgi:hypothetical protein